MYTKQQLIFAVAIMLAMIINVIAQPNQVTNPIDTSGPFGAPTVQITEVKGFTAPGSGFQVRVKWAAQTPATSRLDKFEISVSVRDSNGNTRTGNQTAAGTVRELVIPVSITAKPVSFQANITTFFIPIAQQKRDLNGTFVLDKGNGFKASGATGQSTSPVAGNTLTKCELANGTDLKGFDVAWRLAPVTQDLSEREARITATFTYKNGNQVIGARTANATVGPGTRQTRVTVSAAPVTSLVNVQIEAVIKVEVFFNLIQRTVTTLNGNFPT